jgi:LPS sulfotransferase NodH
MDARARKSPQNLADRYFDQPDYPGRPRFSYLICSAPRSGSTLLCHLLARTGRHGVPHEYFNPRTVMTAMARRFGLLAADQTARIDDDTWVGAFTDDLIRRRTTPNGVFGLKMHFDQFGPLRRSAPVLRLVEGAKAILVTRRDRLGQAISFERAIQTRAWRSNLPERRPPRYDGQAIARRLDQLAAQERSWRAFLSKNDATHLELAYEDMCADSAMVFGAVLHFLGDSPRDGDFRPMNELPMRTQRDEVTEEWRARFLAETGIAAAAR